MHKNIAWQFDAFGWIELKLLRCSPMHLTGLLTVKLLPYAFGLIGLGLFSYFSMHWAVLNQNCQEVSLCIWLDWVKTANLLSYAFGWIELKLSYVSMHLAGLCYNCWAVFLCTCLGWVETVKLFSYASGWIEVKLLSYFSMHLAGFS